MASIRGLLSDNPKVGWGVAAVCFTAAVAVLFVRLQGAGPADSVARLSQDVTLRCTETGEEWTMNRGQFELSLLTYSGELSEDGMFPSPHAEGRLTAVLVDKADWKETVERINAEKAAFAGKRRGSGG